MKIYCLLENNLPIFFFYRNDHTGMKAKKRVKPIYTSTPWLAVWRTNEPSYVYKQFIIFKQYALPFPWWSKDHSSYDMLLGT